METGPEFISYAARIGALAIEHPGKPAVIFSAEGEDQVLTWRRLDDTSNAWARNMSDGGVGEGDVVVIALPNSLQHVFASVGAWKLGALVVAVSAKSPAAERRQVVEAAEQGGGRVVLVGERLEPDIDRPQLAVGALAAPRETSPLPDKTPPGRAVATGGTTGRAKIIVDPNPFGYRGPSPFDRAVGRRPGDRILICGPLYHGGPFMLLYAGLLNDSTVVLMDRFEAARAQELVLEHRVEWVFFVPTHMKRIIEHAGFDPSAFASLRALYHSGAFCPAPLKRRWMEILGPERVMELYGANDALGATVIRGDEWLAHPGSVGRPYNCEIRILDENKAALPAGEIGEIYMRSAQSMFGGATNSDPRAVYYYMGAREARRDIGGFETVGDLGRLDADGYLYLSDRRIDMIVSGGSNIYPAEIEGVLADHPGVKDVAVIGLPDPDWGRRVHAIVELKPGATACDRDLDALVRAHLDPFKAPKSYEFVERLDRNEAGKLQRQKMLADRAAPASA